MKDMHYRIGSTGGKRGFRRGPSYILCGLPMTMIDIDQFASIGVHDPYEGVTARDSKTLTVGDQDRPKIRDIVSTGSDESSCYAFPYL